MGGDPDENNAEQVYFTAMQSGNPPATDAAASVHQAVSSIQTTRAVLTETSMLLLPDVSSPPSQNLHISKRTSIYGD